MKPLETNQLVLTWFGLSPADKAPTKWQKILYKASTFQLILSILSIFISSLAFFYRFVLIDLEKALYAVYQFVGLFSALYLCMVAYLSRPQINSTLNQLSNIYHESKSFDSNSKTFNSNYVTLSMKWMKNVSTTPDANKDSARFLAQANNKSEWMYGILFKTVILAAIWIVAVSVVSVSICWYNHGHFDAKFVYHPLRLEWASWQSFRT